MVILSDIASDGNHFLVWQSRKSGVAQARRFIAL
jgi:hypothetical protein